MLSRQWISRLSALVASAAMLTASIDPAPAFTLAAPTLQNSVAAAQIDKVWWRRWGCGWGCGWGPFAIVGAAGALAAGLSPRRSSASAAPSAGRPITGRAIMDTRQPITPGKAITGAVTARAGGACGARRDGDGRAPAEGRSSGRGEGAEVLGQLQALPLVV